MKKKYYFPLSVGRSSSFLAFIAVNSKLIAYQRSSVFLLLLLLLLSIWDVCSSCDPIIQDDMKRKKKTKCIQNRSESDEPVNVIASFLVFVLHVCGKCQWCEGKNYYLIFISVLSHWCNVLFWYLFALFFLLWNAICSLQFKTTSEDDQHSNKLCVCILCERLVFGIQSPQERNIDGCPFGEMDFNNHMWRYWWHAPWLWMSINFLNFMYAHTTPVVPFHPSDFLPFYLLLFSMSCIAYCIFEAYLISLLFLPHLTTTCWPFRHTRVFVCAHCQIKCTIYSFFFQCSCTMYALQTFSYTIQLLN